MEGKKMAKRFLGKMDSDSYKNGYKVRSSKELRPADKKMMIKGSRVLFSSENCGDEWLTLEGLFEGEMPCRDNPFIPLHEIELVDLCGNTISEGKLYCGDFHPDNIRFDGEPGEDDDFDDSSEEADFIDDSVLLNGDVITEQVAEDIWYRYFFGDPLEESLYFEEMRTNLGVQDEDSHQKNVSMSPQISSLEEGFCWAYQRIRPKAFWKKKYLSRGGQIDNKELPENDRYKNRRVKISRRRAEKLNDFLGNDFCHETIFSQRVALVFTANKPADKPVKLPVMFSPVQEIKEPEKSKIPKKRENKGYFNRQSMMRRQR